MKTQETALLAVLSSLIALDAILYRPLALFVNMALHYLALIQSVHNAQFLFQTANTVRH